MSTSKTHPTGPLQGRIDKREDCVVQGTLIFKSNTLCKLSLLC